MTSPPARPDSDTTLDTTTSQLDGTQELKVSFFPPLHAARSGWILNNLRRERVSSVLDVGCGEGSLLSALSIPAPFLRTHAADSDLGSDPDAYTYEWSASTDGPGSKHDASNSELHIRQLHGLDVSISAVEESVEVTAPGPEPESLAMSRTTALRWELLEVQLWHGSLAAYNPAFVGIECIVSTEVIEHLPAPTLTSFAPTLLGLYRPRLLLLTTPNYAFNARFSPPNAPRSAITQPGRAFADPTGRTTRVFRHADHQFEWTPAELRAWAQAAADAHGYTVEVDAIGRAEEDDPWGRDEEIGGATQVAVFRRREDWVSERAMKPEEMKEGEHALLKTWNHEVHPQAGRPQGKEAIRALVVKYMEEYYLDRGYTVWDLWMEPSIATACGGCLDALIQALEANSELDVDMPGSKSTEWVVKFSGDRHQEAVAMQKAKCVWTEHEEEPYVTFEDAETDREALGERSAEPLSSNNAEQDKAWCSAETWGSAPSWADTGGWG